MVASPTRQMTDLARTWNHLNPEDPLVRLEFRRLGRDLVDGEPTATFDELIQAWSIPRRGRSRGRVVTAVASRTEGWPGRFAAGWRRYWFEPMPPERLDVFARIIAVTVAFSVFVMDRWAVPHQDAPDSFYRPLQIARVLRLPAPTTTTMTMVLVAIAVGCVWAFTRKAPRAANATLLVAYATWLLWAFGWSKVDHDKLTIVVALGVLALTPRVAPTAGGTRGPWPSGGPDGPFASCR